MSFDERKYNATAKAGDVGFNVFVVQNALSRAVSAIEKIAASAQVDVSEDLSSVRSDIDMLKGEFDRFTGWKPE